MLDQHGTVLLDEPDDGTRGRPEVLRGDLRRILLDSLPDGRSGGDASSPRVRPLGDGRHELTFADGSTVTTDLLVGADGAWSKVRPLLSDATPEYVGTTFIETYLYDADERHPATAEGGRRRRDVRAHPGQGDRRPPRGRRRPPHLRPAEPPRRVGRRHRLHRPAAAKARVAAEFDGWAPELTALITDGETAPVPRMIHALPTATGGTACPA